MKIAFIDIDNTLLDFDAYVKTTMEEGFRHFSLKPYEPYMYEIFHTENGKLWNKIEEGTLTFGQLEKIRWNTVFAELGIEFDGVTFERYFRKKLHDSAIPVEGAYRLLEELKKDYMLCAASNGPYEQQMNRIRIAKMDSYFSYCFISEQIGASKPSKQFFDSAFRIIQDGEKQIVLPSDTVMIGDSMTSDIKGGSDYGMCTVYFDKRHTGRPEGNFDYYASSLLEIPELLKRGRQN